MTIGVGIVGLSANQAAWAGVHFAAISSLPSGFKLVALATSSPESAAAAGKAFGVPADKSYSSAEALAKDPDVSLVVISVKAPLHKELALPAINAGKDILVEWPLATTLADAEDLLAAAKSKGVKSAVNLQGRANPGLAKVKEIVESGALGRILSTTFSGSSKFFTTLNDRIAYVADVTTGANTVTVWAGHQLDTFTRILGEFKYLQATTALNFTELPVLDSNGAVIRTINPTAPDVLAISGTLVNGATVSWQVTSTTAKNPDSLFWYIHGEKGSLKLEGDSPFLNILTPGKISWFKDGKWEDVEAKAVTPVDSVAAIYSAFGEGKTDGTYADFEHGVLRHRMLEAIWKSAKDGTRESYL